MASFVSGILTVLQMYSLNQLEFSGKNGPYVTGSGKRYTNAHTMIFL